MKKFTVCVLFFITLYSLFSLEKTDLIDYEWVCAKEVELDLTDVEIPDDVTVKAYVYYELLFYDDYCELKITQVITVNSRIVDQNHDIIRSKYNILQDDTVIIDEVLFFLEDDILMCRVDAETVLAFLKRPKISEFRGGEV